MKKILVFGLLIVFAVWGYLFWQPFDPFDKLRVSDSLRSLREEVSKTEESKKTILRIGLFADSHNENDLLGEALAQAQGMGVNFIIGLGDYTNLGTIDELTAAKSEFEKSNLEYFVTPGDRDGWESRQRGESEPSNFIEVFGSSHQVIEREGVQFVLLDNSDLYKGIGQEGWAEFVSSIKYQVEKFSSRKSSKPKLTFVFAHKTPFHPQSSHIMGEDNAQVAEQAKELLAMLEGDPSTHSIDTQGRTEWNRSTTSLRVNGFFSGDIHFFAQYQSPGKIVKMTTVGAVASDRNFQGPRFAVLTVFDDYSWEIEDVEIR